MAVSDELIEQLKEESRKKGEEMSDEDAREGAQNLVGFFDLLWEMSKKDSIKKKRLKTEPDGFPVDGTYTCLVCSNRIDETNGWYDWYGQTCLLCRKAVKDGMIPTYIFLHRNSYFSMSSLKYRFDIKHQTAKKYIKEGTLHPRIILNETGTPYEYLFLKKENPALIERYSASRKSYDRHNKKRAEAWSRKLKAEMLEDLKNIRRK
ncbi:MAG: hypothetical protein ABA06_01150 [Parcubacteria bacterium C7867-001]|nr:MAG: hypothetical protein ABA06_01150 [Parcubacteria bacterium C7867-001]